MFFHRMYGNTVEGELWAALDSAAQEDSVQLPADIKTIMNSWTLKMGFPVVTIVRNYSSQTAIATQVLYYYNLLGRSKNVFSMGPSSRREREREREREKESSILTPCC